MATSSNGRQLLDRPCPAILKNIANRAQGPRISGCRVLKVSRRPGRIVTAMDENRVKVWRAADLNHAEMLKGVYVRHAYPRHAHEDLCLGLVVGGAVNLRTRTRSGVASAGAFVLVNSDDIHQGWPAADEGWRCRTIHVHP